MNKEEIKEFRYNVFVHGYKETAKLLNITYGKCYALAQYYKIEPEKKFIKKNLKKPK